jgi:preprotein translocase subunit SecG
MSLLITVVHVLTCIFLIVVVLLQRGKGAQVGAVFGGGASTTMFGSRGAGNFLTRMTTACAVVFMLTSLSLSYLRTLSSDELLFEDGVLEDAAAPEESLFEELGAVAPETADPPALAEEATPERSEGLAP